MKVIGLTGGIASGKSAASGYLSKVHHLPVIDADHIAKNVSERQDILQAIAAQLGPEMLDTSGKLDRKKMGQLIADDPNAKAVLDSIMHPAIEAEVCAAISACRERKESVVIYDCPLLFETHNERFTDEVLLISVEEDVRIHRLMARDGIDEAYARKKIAIQMPEAEKAAKSQYIVDNSGTPEDLHCQLDQLVEKWEMK